MFSVPVFISPYPVHLGALSSDIFFICTSRLPDSVDLSFELLSATWHSRSYAKGNRVITKERPSGAPSQPVDLMSPPHFVRAVHIDRQPAARCELVGEGDLVKLPIEDCKGGVSRIEACCAKNNEGHAKREVCSSLLEQGSRGLPRRRFGNTFRESSSEEDRFLNLYKWLVVGKVL